MGTVSTQPISLERSHVPESGGPDKDVGRLIDRFGRIITDLRVSVTDRCNYKCVYCRTGNEGAQYSELPLGEYLRMIRIFVDLGIEKVRLTGGEPLLRSGLADLVGEIANLRTRFRADGSAIEDENAGRRLDIAVTTNGHLLGAQARRLKEAGLTRVTVSMDAVDPAIVTRLTRVPGSYEKVLAGIRAARDAGLGPVKVNCVLLRGFNDDQIVPFAHFARAEGIILRFIEFMPLEEDRIWSRDTVIPYDELLQRLSAVRPLAPLEATTKGETAQRFTFDDGVGEIGIIAPVSRAFCGACSRIRLTSDGQIRTCLFSQSDHDLYGIARRGGSDEDLVRFIRRTVHTKEARHHIGEAGFLQPSRSMVHIGG